MYTIKPILNRVDLELPTCMYKLKSTEASENKPETTSFLADLSKQVELISRQNESRAMESLAERQDIIIDKLEELKSQLVSMKHSMRMCFKPAQPVSKPANMKSNSGFKLKVNIRDIIINLHPDHLPLSFPLLKKLYSKSLPLKFSFFTHSSVASLPKAALDFQEVLLSEGNQDGELKVNIIWKSGNTNAEMILSPIDHVPIYHEVNILRFLSRIGVDSLNYELQANPNESDKIFDICFKLFNIQVDGERPKLIENLVSYAEKQDKLTQVSFVDLAVYSALASSKSSIPKSQSHKAAKWLKAVESITV